MENKERLLNPEEAAKFLGVSVSSIKCWVMNRQITYTKIGASIRFKKEWLDEMVEENKRERREVKK